MPSRSLARGLDGRRHEALERTQLALPLCVHGVGWLCQQLRLPDCGGEEIETPMQGLLATRLVRGQLPAVVESLDGGVAADLPK